MAARLGLAADVLRARPAEFGPEGVLRVMNQHAKLSRVELPSAAPPLVPRVPLVPLGDFLEIWRYLIDRAPETPLPQVGKTPVALDETPFRLGPRVAFDPADNVMVTLVHVDEERRRVFLGGVRGFPEGPAFLAVRDGGGELTAKVELDSAPVSAQRTGKDYLVADIGSLPTVQSWKAQLLRVRVRGKRVKRDVILDGQVRAAGAAVHVEDDGTRLIAFNGFGYYLGELLLLREKKGKLLSRTTLLSEPGAMISRFGDFNGDGRLDLLTLVSQYRESIVLFQDDGLGGFETVPLIAHHPAWGSSHFDLADMNGDGRPDLVMTNGDNTDYPDAPLKNYHGVRIYLDVAGERETPSFEERFFEPIHGAYEVLARDFDLDGDVDLALIARSGDERAAPREDFLYMENETPAGTADFHFAVSAVRELQASQFSRMDAGDVDGDGDPDVVLGGWYSRSGLARPGAGQTPLSVAYLINGTR